ncbi:hypothetical protein A7982_13674 [Minicystis rosea]|nr:hypothetical protein A7982_13674 [Minicystis rosea]
MRRRERFRRPRIRLQSHRREGWIDVHARGATMSGARLTCHSTRATRHTRWLTCQPRRIRR